MIARTCSSVRRRLSAFHDGELTVREQIAVEAHLRECPGCGAEVAQLRAVGDALRSVLTPDTRRDELAGLSASVVSRLKAEREESLAGWANRVFDDMHLVWAALGAAGATAACLALMVGMFHLGVRQSPDSLSALLTAMASPGSDANPVSPDPQMILLPRSSNAHDILPASIIEGRDETTVTVSTVITRDGRIKEFSILGAGNTDPRDMANILRGISNARFEPARYGTSPVAVNMVWMVAHLTVRAKLSDQSSVTPPPAGQSLGVSQHARPSAAISA
jgi:Putative zinc-finger